MLQSQYVYLVRADIMPGTRGWSHASAGPHKIGRTKRLDQRLKELAKPAGIVITVVHTVLVTNAPVLEDTLKRLYAPQALGGEWFDLSDDDVHTIIAVMT